MILCGSPQRTTPAVPSMAEVIRSLFWHQLPCARVPNFSCRSSDCHLGHWPLVEPLAKHSLDSICPALLPPLWLALFLSHVESCPFFSWSLSRRSQRVFPESLYKFNRITIRVQDGLHTVQCMHPSEYSKSTLF